MRWAFVVVAIPGGLFLGFTLATQICVAVLHAQGTGNSHDDIIAIAIWQMLGTAIGAFGLPMVIWQFTKKKSKQPIPSP